MQKSVEMPKYKTVHNLMLYSRREPTNVWLLLNKPTFQYFKGTKNTKLCTGPKIFTDSNFQLQLKA